MVVLSPWALGSIDPVFEFALDAGIALLLVLWAAKVAIDGQFVWFRCPVTLCLAGLFLWGALQLIPLPGGILSAVAPANARLYRELLTPRPEFADVPQAMSHPISLYPTGTRNELFQLLAVFVVFVCVRTQLSSTRALRRLGLACVINGTLLSLFGFAQMSSKIGVVKWPFMRPGHSFSSFVNHGDYAAYVNLCLGLGLGLLLASGRTKKRGQYYRVMDENESGAAFSPGKLLQTPRQLWLCAALGVMAAGIVACLARGGVVALAGAITIALAMRTSWPPRLGRLEALLIPGVLAAALLAWLGSSTIEKRLGTVVSGEALADPRVEIWTNIARTLPDFALLGSGYGTVNAVEHLGRREDFYYGPDVVADVVHAHNDYLEALVEGGVPRLALTLALVWFLVRFGRRAFDRHGDRTPGLLAFGALVGVLAIVIHSFVDFIMFTPAVALLATVVAAQLCSLSRSMAHEWPDPSQSNVSAVRGYGPAAVLGVALLVPPAVLLFLHGRQLDLADRFRVAAYRAIQAKPPDPEAAAAAMESAVRAMPDDAYLHIDAGQVHLDARLYALQQDALRPARQVEQFAAAVGVCADGAGEMGALPAAALSFAWGDTSRPPAALEQELAQRHLLPALRHFVAARNLYPLLPQPNVRLATFATDLEFPDSVDAYWTRAERLAATDPELWYYAGLYHLRSGEEPRAWQEWRRSLELGTRRLGDVVNIALPRLGPEGLMDKVLPDDPATLLAAAQHADPDAPAEGKMRPLVERCVALLDARGGAMTSREAHAHAVALKLVGRPDDALKAYDKAVRDDAAPPEWQFEYAQLLFERGKLQQAQNVLDVLLLQKPGFAGAKELREKVAHERAVKD